MKKSDDLIILVDTPPIGWDYKAAGSVFPTNALMLLGTLLKKNGFNVCILDGRFFDDYLDRLATLIQENNVLFVGMSVMTVNVPAALETSTHIKKLNKKIPIVWGGPHPTLHPKQTIIDENIDITVINEGTITILDIAKSFIDGDDYSDIKGIGCKDKHNKAVFTSPAEIDKIEHVPYFDFSLIDAEKYMRPNISVYQREFPSYPEKIIPAPLLTGLGCPYKCEFCFNVILKRKYRFKSAQSIVEEIKYLQKEYAVNTFIFMDEEFFINKKRFFRFLDAVEKEGLNFNWRMWCRVDRFSDDYLSQETLLRLSKIGCGSLVMGGESGNQDVLDSLNKKTTTKQIINSLTSLLNIPNIIPRYSFMVGLENENYKQIHDTYKLCLKMKKIKDDVDIAGPFPFRLYPGSPIYNRLVTKFSISAPTELTKWNDFLNNDSTTYTEMPWAPAKFRKNFELILFYSNHAFTTISKDTKIFKRLLKTILKTISRFRIRKFLFLLPIEFWGLKVVRVTKMKLFRNKGHY